MSKATITNKITDASGNPVAGCAVEVQLLPGGGFRTLDSSEVAQTLRTVTDSSGVWSLPLERNQDILPSGTYYQVVEKIPGGERKWNIQVSHNGSLLDALVATPPSIPPTQFLTQDSADARYVRSPGSYGGSGDIQPVRYGDAADAGVEDAYARIDHKHAFSETPYTVCTRSTRPTSPREGHYIYESDTRRAFRYAGGPLGRWSLDGGHTPKARITNSSPETLPPSPASTALRFETVRYDVGGCFSPANPTRLVVPADCGGLYVIGGSLRFRGGHAGSIRQIYVRINGSQIIAVQSTPGGTGADWLTIQTEWFMGPGNYAEFIAVQGSPNNMPIDVAPAYSPEFWMHWAGPWSA